MIFEYILNVELMGLIVLLELTYHFCGSLGGLAPCRPIKRVIEN